MLWINLFLPGAGLILRGRLISGALALILSMILLGLMIVAPLMTTESLATSLCIKLFAGYVALSLLSSMFHWFIARKRVLDHEQLRRLHQEVCQAYLNDKLDAALQLAQQICKEAGTVIGSWQLLALVADAKGDLALARSARKQAQAIQDQDDDL